MCILSIRVPVPQLSVTDEPCSPDSLHSSPNAAFGVWWHHQGDVKVLKLLNSQHISKLSTPQLYLKRWMVFIESQQVRSTVSSDSVSQGVQAVDMCVEILPSSTSLLSNVSRVRDGYTCTIASIRLGQFHCSFNMLSPVD